MIIDKINVGSAPDDGTGDSVRNAFIKVNNNYDAIEANSEELKEYVDESIANIPPVDLSAYETIANNNAKLALKVNTSEMVNYATKTYVNDAIDGIVSISFELVDELPTTGETNKIYLVPNGNLPPNVKDEYIWIEDQWELIGNTDIDLSSYYEKDEVDSLLSNKVNVSELVPIQTDIDNLETADAQNVKLTGDQTKSGVLTLTSSPIVPTPTTGIQAANKSYVDGLIQPPVLAKVGSGLRRQDTVQANYLRALGSNAVDFSDAPAPGQYGAGGNNSFAGGIMNGIGGNAINAVVFGSNNEIFSPGSAVFGANNLADTNASFSLLQGSGLTSLYSNSFIIGRYNANYGNGSASWNGTDEIFIVGNGSNPAAKSNAYAMFKNGSSIQNGIASYGADYSTNYTNRSLVDRGYVLNPTTFITLLQNATPTQITEIKTLLGV